MTVREHVSLRELTTLKVGGEARYVLTIETEDDIATALAYVRERGVPFVVLGEGSNVLPSDSGYEGALLLMQLTGIEFVGDGTSVRVGAGTHWDDFVREAALRGLWGLENLAGIPGTVGAAPVQNIGAYGMELRQTLTRVEGIDAMTGEPFSFGNNECAFGYRDSRFKHEPNLIITFVTFALLETGAPQIGYSDLARAHDEGKDLSNPEAIGETVRSIRARKFPDLSEFGTAGSFFKNPIISPERFGELAAKFGAVPSFPADGGTKVPLAFILDRVLSLKGYQKGKTFLFGNQPLVLVAEQGALASDVDALAHEIETKVFEATGITIEREVRMLDAHESK